MMARRIAVGLVLALCAPSCHAPAGSPPRAATLAIIHAAVIDGTGAPAMMDMTILVDGERIAAIGPSARMAVPHGTRVVDARGRFAIPGLSDMHVHLAGGGAALLRRMAVSGITRVRDMGAPIDDILRLRQEANASRDLPRVIAAGPKLEGPLPFRHPLVRSVASPDEARRAVDELQARGVDFIKVGDSLTPELYAAIADESRRRRIPFAGHLPAAIRALDASRLGQRSIEHFGSASFHGLLIACSTSEVELRRFATETLAAGMSGKISPESVEDRLFGADFTGLIASTYSADRAAALFAAFARNGTWQVPTLGAIRDLWDGKTGLAPADREAGRRLRERYGEMIRAMRTAGVKLMAGSDIEWAADRPAAPLHDELVLLVQAGLTPMEALQTATRNPAEFLGALRTEGTIEVGKEADIVLLDASPLEDIASTRRVSTVVRAGRLVEPGTPPAAEPTRSASPGSCESYVSEVAPGPDAAKPATPPAEAKAHAGKPPPTEAKRHEGSGMVLDKQGVGPQLCLGGFFTSLPPQCRPGARTAWSACTTGSA